MNYRKLAKQNSELFYRSDKKCPQNHDSLRYTSTGTCVMCMSHFTKTDAYRKKTQEYRDSRKDKKAEYDRQFDIKNKAYRNSLKSINRAKRKQRIVEWDVEFFEFVFEEAYRLCDLRKKNLGTDWHLDHIYPLCSKQVSGLHNPYNIQVVPAKWNLSKGNRHCKPYFPIR